MLIFFMLLVTGIDFTLIKTWHFCRFDVSKSFPFYLKHHYISKYLKPNRNAFPEIKDPAWYYRAFCDYSICPT
jgi:hypothetical protein